VPAGVVRAGGRTTRRPTQDLRKIMHLTECKQRPGHLPPMHHAQVVRIKKVTGRDSREHSRARGSGACEGQWTPRITQPASLGAARGGRNTPRPRRQGRSPPESTCPACNFRAREGQERGRLFLPVISVDSSRDAGWHLSLSCLRLFISLRQRSSTTPLTNTAVHLRRRHQHHHHHHHHHPTAHVPVGPPPPALPAWPILCHGHLRLAFPPGARLGSDVRRAMAVARIGVLRDQDLPGSPSIDIGPSGRSRAHLRRRQWIASGR
jgi:hypothetical protein